MEKAEIQTIKAIRSQKPISDKEYKELKRQQAITDKWLEDLRKNYPGIMVDEATVDGMTIYYGGEWW